MTKYDNDNWGEFAEISRALADESRIMIMAMLMISEMCVCQIVEILKLAPSTISKHLSILQSAGLINGRKKGRWVYYDTDRVSGVQARRALKYIAESIGETPRLAGLEKKVNSILKEDTDKLCRRVYGDGKDSKRS